MIFEKRSATIANGESLSGALDLGGQRLLGLFMPAAWTAADLTFQVSQDGATWADLYDETGAEITVDAAASRAIVFSNPALFLGVKHLKIRSGTTGAAVAQGAERVIVTIAAD